MFAALVILSTVISAASATKSLSVSTTVPSSLADVDSLQVVTTIANTGDEALRLLNDPDSPLSTWATRSFDVKNADGKDAEFNGVIVRYAPEVAAKSEDASEWTILAPGESVDVTHDVGLYYDFTKTGAGAFPPRTGPEAGFVKVHPTLQVAAHPNIFTIGDVIEWNEQKQVLKAYSHASTVSQNILKLDAQQPLKNYKSMNEALCCTTGRHGGLTFANYFGGITLGDWFTRTMKSRDLLVPESRKAMGLSS